MTSLDCKLVGTCLASSGSWGRKQAQRPKIDVRWSLTNASSRDTPCWRQVTKTLAKIECAKAPRAARLQPVVFRIMTAGRSMRGLIVGGIQAFNV